MCRNDAEAILSDEGMDVGLATDEALSVIRALKDFIDEEEKGQVVISFQFI